MLGLLALRHQAARNQPSKLKHWESNSSAGLCICCTLTTEHELWDLLPNLCFKHRALRRETQPHFHSVTEIQLRNCSLPLNMFNTRKRDKSQKAATQRDTTLYERNQNQQAVN